MDHGGRLTKEPARRARDRASHCGIDGRVLGLAVYASWVVAACGWASFFSRPAAASPVAERDDATTPVDSTGSFALLADNDSTFQLELRLVDSVKASLPILKLRGPLRGDLSAPALLKLPPATRTVSLSIPPLVDVPARSLVRMELKDARGRLVFSSARRQIDFDRHRYVLLSSKGRPLVPGRYTLSLAEQPSRRRGPDDLQRAAYGFSLGMADR